jgi:tetratricopeptide (TPR) repeat protein
MKYRLLLCGFFLMIGIVAYAQQPDKLAQEYYRNGEYEKAVVLYKQLYEQNPYSDFYFTRYLTSLLSLEDYKTAEGLIKKQIKAYPDKIQLYVNYGNLHERQFEMEKAREKYEEAIEQLPSERYQVIRLANSFVQLTKYDLALQTYEKGQKVLKDKKLFSYELGDLYRRKGDSQPMISNYLNALLENPSRLTSMKTLFQRYLIEDDFKELKIQLYDRIRENPNESIYPEMLTWLFIQDKDYKSALRQVRAMDKRLKENGGRVYRLAQTAARDKDYGTAIKAYMYIVDEKGKTNTYYIEAKREILICKRSQLVAGYDYTMEELRTLETEYFAFLTEFGKNKNTASIVLELAELEALYINDLDKAIELLAELVEFPGIQDQLQAKGKISLADYYLMQGERWEATLLYSQVDKDYKDDVLGQTARFKNAKLSYYMGDFEWAQAQFSILKASTSKLIANDALDLSVFIMDNLGLDTTVAPMYMFAKADLLAFQNQFDAAFEVMDSIKSQFPKHSLEDDILYTKAKIYLKQQDLAKAASLFEMVASDYPESIRIDNALFELAELNEFYLDDKTKATEFYKRIFMEHSASTFAVESRKRYQRLVKDVQ